MRPLLAAVALLWLGSCSGPTDYFADYREADLLADTNKGLSSFTVGYQAQGVDVGAFPYAEWTAVMDAAEIGSTAGLPDGAQVYRFEIANLLANGDFEGADISQWSTTGDGTATLVDDTVLDAVPITSNSLDFWLSTDQRLILDLDGAVNVADGLVAGAEYAINLDYNADPNIARLYFGFQTSAPNDVPKDWVATIFELGGQDYDTWQFPETTGQNGRVSILSAAGTAQFRIGRDSSPQAGTLDNIRLSRSDIRPFVEITISQSETDPTRPLVAGSDYEFSVYVKPEVDAMVSPATPNRHRANGISLWVNDEIYSESAESWPMDEWTKVSLQFELPEFSMPEDPDAVVLRLRFSPAMYSDQDAGSLLVAAPELVFGSSEARTVF